MSHLNAVILEWCHPTVMALANRPAADKSRRRHKRKNSQVNLTFTFVYIFTGTMGLTLYHFPPSGPSRGALLAAKALGLDVDVHEVNLFNKEQLKEDFIKINPQHTVPTLTDGDFTLWDSHVIATYLATVYGKDPDFYPVDPKKRAVVDQRLNFDCGTLYPRIRAICAVGWDVTPYANVSNWLARCALTIPGYREANQVGADQFGKAVKGKLAPGQLP